MRFIKMQTALIRFTSCLLLISFRVTSSFKYEAPDFCTWSLEENATSRVALTCKVRTLNGDVTSNRTPSLTSVQSEGTSTLNIECSPQLFFESNLVANMFQRLAQLEELEIDNCKISQLQEGVFHGLRDLKRLSVRTHNSLWSSSRQLELMSTSFEGLKEVQILDLAYNNIREMPDGLFCQLSNLNTLNLSNNALRQIDPTLLGATSGSEMVNESMEHSSEPCDVDVISLDVSYNNLINLPSVLSSPKRRRLQQLYVQNNQLTSLRASSLTGLTALRIVNASSNALVDLPAVPLRETCRELREVHLRENSLHDLGDTFQRLEQLLVLDVAHNQLVNLGTSLSGLIRLIVLDLSANAMIRLEPLVFKDLYSLQILDLRDNAIATISDDTFLPLYNLHTLNLAGNRLTNIGPAVLNGLFVLNKLTLSLNLLTEIHPQAFRNCSDLKELDLSGNVLSEVPAALTKLPFLRTLDLGENRIVGFKNGSFRNMHHLTGLRLIDNNIGNVTADMLWDLVALQVLNLAKNKIQLVERGAFDRNEKLEAIRLDANYLTDVNGVFTSLPSLVWLNLSDNHLVWFDYAFVPPSLQWLDIHSNFVEKLGNYYEILDGFHLRTVDASNNRLTELTALSLPNSVEIFFANNNRVLRVAAGTFIEKHNLTRVDLYANELEYLDLSSLRIAHEPISEDRELPEFYLGGNPFRCDCTMEWLQRVHNMSHNDQLQRQYPRVMDLDDIVCRMAHARDATTPTPILFPVTDLRAHHFLCRYEAHCFALCHCCDFDACDCEMTCPQNCTCYHDQSWSNNIVDCSATGHVTLPTRIPMDVTELYLDGNDIQELRNHAFIGRKNLRVLFANNSAVEAIQNRTFTGLNSLEALFLHDNRIQILKGYEFEHLMHLRELYLQNNRLVHITNTTFLPLRSLKLLRLDGNRLASFPIWQLQHNAYLTDLLLSNNPWACRCRFSAELRNWLQLEGHSVLDYGAQTCLQVYIGEECDPEDENDYTPLLGTPVPRLFMNDYLPTLIVTIFIVSLVIIMAVLAFAYRDNVRLWVFARYGVRLFHKTSSAASAVSKVGSAASLKREDKEKLYDAYMCYSPKDEEELVYSVAHGLERGQPRYSLCLHYRDLPVISNSRDAAVMDASEASRRVILVVTRNFLQTEWPRREFRAALHESLHGRTFKLIIVEESGGLPPEVERDPDLRPYLKTARRIRWGDKRFWERIRYSMPEIRTRDLFKHSINYTLDNRGIRHHQPVVATHRIGTFPGKRKQFSPSLNTHSQTLFHVKPAAEDHMHFSHPVVTPRARPTYTPSPRTSEHIYSCIDSDYSVVEHVASSWRNANHTGLDPTAVARESYLV